MFALSFIYVVFMSYLSYIVLEKKGDCVKDRMFWVILGGLGISFYLTTVMFKLL